MALTTTYLAKAFGQAETQQALREVKDLHPELASKTSDLHLFKIGDKYVTITGIFAFDQGGEPPKGNCECPIKSCGHALAALWHIALERENTTAGAWITHNAAPAPQAAPCESDLAYKLLGPARRPNRVSFSFDPEACSMRILIDGKPADTRSSQAYLTSTDRAVSSIRTLLSTLDGDRRRRELRYRVAGPLVRSAFDLALMAGLLTLPNGETLHIAEPIRATPIWTVDAAGAQRCRIAFPGDDSGAILHDLCGAVVIHGNQVSTVIDDLPEGALTKLAAIGPIPAAQASTYSRAIAKRLGRDVAPRPISLEKRKAKPRARLELDETVEDDGRHQKARISAEYDWGSFAPGRGSTAAHTSLEGDVLVEHTRDTEAEKAILASATDKVGGTIHELDTAVEIDFGDNDDASARFQSERVHAFEQSGSWTIHRTENWSSNVHPWSGRLAVELNGTAFAAFEMSIMANLSGITEDLLPGIAALVERLDGPILTRDEAAEALDRMIPNGEYGVRTASGIAMIPSEVLKPVVLTMWVLLQREPIGAAFEFGLTSLAEINGMGSEIDLRCDKRLGKLLSILNDLDISQTPVPAAFNSIKYEVDQCQREALNWMQCLHRAGYGGLLCDEMGVGKTLSILLHAVSLHEQGLLSDQALISVPKGATGRWVEDLSEFFPSIPFHVWEGAGRNKHADRLENAVIVITTSPTLQNDRTLTARPWSLFVPDEAHDQRTPDRLDTQAMMDIVADQKIPVTATPIENHLGDLWTLMQIANPGLLGTIPQFRKIVRDPIEKNGDSVAHQTFVRFVSPFVMGRTMEEAGHHVPKPRMHEVAIDLGQAQARYYEEERLAASDKFQDYLKKMGRRASPGAALSILTRLRQVCCHPILAGVDSATAAGVAGTSAKTEAIVAHAVELAAQGKKILISSFWTSHIAILQDRLAAEGIRFRTIHGKIGVQARRDAERDFKNPDLGIDVLFISAKTGGRSLSINEADAVFLCDPWWNPQPERQAIARARRRGQTKVIDVYRFFINNSIEQQMFKIQDRKMNIANVLTSLSTPAAITMTDFANLLIPMARSAANDDDRLRMAV